MLVTDGATEMYDDVFEKYNWPERKVRLPLRPEPSFPSFNCASSVQFSRPTGKNHYSGVLDLGEKKILCRAAFVRPERICNNCCAPRSAARINATKHVGNIRGSI